MQWSRQGVCIPECNGAEGTHSTGIHPCSKLIQNSQHEMKRFCISGCFFRVALTYICNCHLNLYSFEISQVRVMFEVLLNRKQNHNVSIMTFPWEKYRNNQILTLDTETSEQWSEFYWPQKKLKLNQVPVYKRSLNLVIDLNSNYFSDREIIC